MATWTLPQFVQKFGEYTESNPLLVRIRNFNREMISALDKNCEISGKTVLDVGASILGYGLEAALKLKVERYEGVTLDIEKTYQTPIVEVRAGSSTGRLLEMNAEELKFPDQSFDCLLSASTFEHFLHPDVVLAEMHRVLTPGGVALISFDGVWSCSYGHHLLQFGSIRELVPPWSHLFLSEEQFVDALGKRAWPSDATVTVREAAEYVYHSEELNRLGIQQLRQFFEESAFDIVWMTPLPDERIEEHRPIAQFLATILPWNVDELLTRGFSMLLKKRKTEPVPPEKSSGMIRGNAILKWIRR